jgi:hypothetical protein
VIEYIAMARNIPRSIPVSTEGTQGIPKDLPVLHGDAPEVSRDLHWVSVDILYVCRDISGIPENCFGSVMLFPKNYLKMFLPFYPFLESFRRIQNYICRYIFGLLRLPESLERLRKDFRRLPEGLLRLPKGLH